MWRCQPKSILEEPESPHPGIRKSDKYDPLSWAELFTPLMASQQYPTIQSAGHPESWEWETLRSKYSHCSKRPQLRGDASRDDIGKILRWFSPVSWHFCPSLIHKNCAFLSGWPDFQELDSFGWDPWVIHEFLWLVLPFGLLILFSGVCPSYIFY